MLAVIVVHNTLAAERLGLLSGLAGADGIEGDVGAVTSAGLLAGALFLQLLQVGPAGYGRNQRHWNVIENI